MIGYLPLSPSGCRTAACDLVFILDGSWSVEDVNFDIVKRWLVNITTSFNIGQKFVQVGVVQYSDDPVLQIPLGKHLSNKDVIAAMESIEYMGGNTRTGTAIQFATDKLFGLSERGPGGIARIAVVLTDGKSQDTVLKAAEAARKKGIIIFAIGVGSETEVLELQDIANKPSSTYVFSVVDYKAIDKIREVIRQKLCEGTKSSASCLSQLGRWWDKTGHHLDFKWLIESCPGYKPCALNQKLVLKDMLSSKAKRSE